MLVPEIALTPQTVGRFRARFGDTVALLHSALGEGERYDEWRRLRTGEARIAVGPRSAVFAPVRDLGLIVVDEEHDPSYKHEGDPRYDARHVAAGADPARVRRLPRRLGHAAAGDVAAAAAPDAARSASGAGRCRRCEVLDMRGARASAASRDAARAARARARRSCCSTGAAGRTSSPAGRAGRSGSARSATSRWCCIAPSTSSPATTAATASAVPGALRRVRLAVRRPLRRRHRAAGGRARRARSTCPCSGSTPTRRPRRTPCPRCWRGSPPRPPDCSSARRWWPRGTTSRTSRSAWSSTPTRRCASPTSAPRSGRSR